MFNQFPLPDISFQWQQLAPIVLFYFLAWLIHRLARRIAGRFMRLSHLGPKNNQPGQPRQETLRGLMAGTITFLVFSAATLLSLSLFVDAATLVWMVGLFSAAFGLGARPLVIKLKIEAADLSAALPLLEELGQEAVTLLPNLPEPWQVISESGETGQQAELTLVAKARFGNAAEMRPRLLTLVSV